MRNVHDFREQIADWTFDDWKHSLVNGTDKFRFEYCLDQDNRIKCMRSIQGYSGEGLIDANCTTTSKDPHGWTDYILSSWINVGLSVFFPKEDSLQERSEHNRDGKRAS